MRRKYALLISLLTGAAILLASALFALIQS